MKHRSIDCTIPDGVIELCEHYFSWCESVRCVRFGGSSTLERIGCEAFGMTSTEFLSISASVVELGEKCFYECSNLRCLTLGALSKHEHFCALQFSTTSIESLYS